MSSRLRSGTRAGRTTSVASAHLAQRALPGLWTFVVAACVALIFFFQMRACDEVKDHAEDCKYRPERPVPRGLVTLRSIVVLALCLAGLAALLTVTLTPWLLILLVLVWVWLALDERPSTLTLVGGAIVITAGFGETGHEGHSIDRQLLLGALFQAARERDRETRELLSKVEVDEDAAAITVEGERATLACEALFSRLRRGTWEEAWRARFTAELVDGDDGWEIVRSRHEDLRGTHLGR